MGIVDDETLAALREASEDVADAGYQILWNDQGVVQLIVVGPDDEDPMMRFGMPREVARRMGMRLLIAAERSRRATRRTGSS